MHFEQSVLGLKSLYLSGKLLYFESNFSMNFVQATQLSSVLNISIFKSLKTYLIINNKNKNKFFVSFLVCFV